MDGFEARDVNVDEMRVGAADAGRRAGAAALRAVFVAKFYLGLVSGFAALQERKRVRFGKRFHVVEGFIVKSIACVGSRFFGVWKLVAGKELAVAVLPCNR